MAGFGDFLPVEQGGRRAGFGEGSRSGFETETSPQADERLPWPKAPATAIPDASDRKKTPAPFAGGGRSSVSTERSATA